MLWKFKGHEIKLHRTSLMGIVNITPDSFSDGGHFFRPQDAIDHAISLFKLGAHILDLGAESSRPGADAISDEEEMQRLLPVLKGLRPLVPIPISIDTTKATVAEACLREGANIINDVSGLHDSGAPMARVVSRYQAGLILMHRRGNAKTMQSFSEYQNCVQEVISELFASVETAITNGVAPHSIAVDPGLGFSKKTEHNFEILQSIDQFQDMGYPVVLGPSRKSFLGTVTGKKAPDREFATAAVVAYCVIKGIPIVRIHDVSVMKDVVTTLEAIRGDHYVRA